MRPTPCAGASRAHRERPREDHRRSRSRRSASPTRSRRLERSRRTRRHPTAYVKLSHDADPAVVGHPLVAEVLERDRVDVRPDGHHRAGEQEPDRRDPHERVGADERQGERRRRRAARSAATVRRPSRVSARCPQIGFSTIRATAIAAITTPISLRGQALVVEVQREEREERRDHEPRRHEQPVHRGVVLQRGPRTRSRRQTTDVSRPASRSAASSPGSASASVISSCTVVDPADPRERDAAELRAVGDDDHLRGALHQRPVRVGLDLVVRREPGRRGRCRRRR